MIRKEFILSELKYRYPEIKEFIRRPREAVGRPLFLEDGQHGFGERIIICTASELDQMPNINPSPALFLCIGMPGQQVTDTLDLCVLPADEAKSALFNFVQRLFDRLDEWRQRLKERSETAEDVSALLDAAAQMLQNPLWLCDARLHVVSRAERFYEELGGGEVFASYKLSDQMRDELPLEEGTVARIFQGDSPEYLISPVQSGGAQFFLICAANERPFYGSDEVVLEYLGGFVKLMLSERKLSVRALRQDQQLNEIERQIRALLARTAPEREAAGALAQLGWDDRSGYCVAAAEPADGDLRAPQLHTLCDRIENEIPDCCAFYEPPSIVLVIRSESGANRSFTGTLRELGQREGIRFGVCEPLNGLADLDRRLSIARETLRRAGGAQAASFADVAEHYLCDRAVSEYPAALVCLRSVSEMAAYDLEHNTNYVETVERYLHNRFNAVKTAGDLFIHRSTFLYRLERIKEQFGLDLESELPAPVHLLISLQLAREQSGIKK